MAYTVEELKRGGSFAPEDGSLFNHIHFSFRNGRHPLYLHIKE